MEGEGPETLHHGVDNLKYLFESPPSSELNLQMLVGGVVFSLVEVHLVRVRIGVITLTTHHRTDEQKNELRLKLN